MPVYGDAEAERDKLKSSLGSKNNLFTKQSKKSLTIGAKVSNT